MKKLAETDYCLLPSPARPFRGDVPLLRFKYAGYNWKLRIWRGDKMKFCGHECGIAIDMDRREILTLSSVFDMKNLYLALRHARDAATRSRWAHRRETNEAKAA